MPTPTAGNPGGQGLPLEEMNCRSDRESDDDPSAAVPPCSASILGAWRSAMAIAAAAGKIRRLPAPETDGAVADARQPKPGRSARPWRSLARMPDWAQLDPDFAAGMKALARRGLEAPSHSGRRSLRDARNADIQNYLGYAYRRLRQLDAAFAALSAGADAQSSAAQRARASRRSLPGARQSRQGARAPGNTRANLSHPMRAI